MEINDKVYYEWDGKIEGFTITEKIPRTYLDDDGLRVDYELLRLVPDNKEYASGFCEDYNLMDDAVDENDPRVVAYKAKINGKKMLSIDSVCEWLSKHLEITGKELLIENFRNDFA